MRLIDADSLRYRVQLLQRKTYMDDEKANFHDHECTIFAHMIDDEPTVLTVELPKGITNGKWKRAIGYMTGGGDPCWKCPCCGGSLHVKGIEHPEPHPKYCKDCGARIEGEEW